MEIEAQPVEWRGVQFDSLLESSWAASLTFWECEWIHHPGGIDLAGGGWWEPDFLIVGGGPWGTDILLECKGAHNDRLWKAQEVQEAHPDNVVLIGRAPWIDSRDMSEYPGAVWHRPDGSEYVWDLNGRGVEYVSAQLASEDKPGLVFLTAVGSRYIK